MLSLGRKTTKYTWPQQPCTSVKGSQKGVQEREGFSYAPKFPGSPSKQVSVSQCVPTAAPDSLCSLSSVAGRGIQLFEVDKNICTVPRHSTCVLSSHESLRNIARCNKPLSFYRTALNPHSSSLGEQIKADALLLLFCQP